MKLRPFSGYKYLRKASRAERTATEEQVLASGTVDVRVYRGLVLDGLVGLSLCNSHGLSPSVIDMTQHIRELWPKAHPFFYSLHYQGMETPRHVYLVGNLIKDYMEDAGISKEDAVQTFKSISCHNDSFYDSSYKLCKHHSKFAEPLIGIDLHTGPELAHQLYRLAVQIEGEDIEDMERFLVEQTNGLKAGEQRASDRRKISAGMKQGLTQVGKFARILGGLRGATNSLSKDEVRRWKELNSNLEAVLKEAQDLRTSLDTFL